MDLVKAINFDYFSELVNIKSHETPCGYSTSADDLRGQTAPVQRSCVWCPDSQGHPMSSKGFNMIDIDRPSKSRTAV